MPRPAATVAIRKNTEFETFAADGEESHRRQRQPPPVARVSAASIESCSCAFDRARRLGHPEHHRGQDGGREKRDQPSNSLLLFCGNSAVGAVKVRCPSAVQAATATPTPTQTAGSHPAAGLFEISRNDADDQRGLDPFAEHDQIGGKHQERTVR